MKAKQALVECTRSRGWMNYEEEQRREAKQDIGCQETREGSKAAAAVVRKFKRPVKHPGNVGAVCPPV